jgi:hypothetical protein
MAHVYGFGRRNGLWLAASASVLLFVLASLPTVILAAGPQTPLSIDVTSASPREVEAATASAVQRDYLHAWQSLASALEKNRGDLLAENFVGGARQQWQGAIGAQQQNSLSRRIVDHGHQMRVTFYSPDGSAMEAIDSVDLEIEYREGSRVLSSERVQSRYLVLLTPGDNSWKVRVLQELPPG